MYYTGFADEAATSIEGQIKATKTLGWANIESRSIDGKNIHDLSEADFDIVAGKLKDSGVQINCFGSTVANWSKDPTSDADFQKSLEELDRSIQRMHQLGTKMIRAMSFKVLKDRSPSDAEIEKLVIQKVKALVKRCEDNDILFLHENCMNFGGQSFEHSLKLVEGVASPNFKLVFDTGNPPFTDLRVGEGPYKKQNSWEFYKNIKDHIHYIHIKDAIFDMDTDGIFPKSKFTWPGEGDGDVKRIVKDLLANGYDGGFSMEPHMEIVFHEESGESKDNRKLNNYIEYGQRFMKLVEECKKELAA